MRQKYTVLEETRRPDKQLSTYTLEIDESDDLKNARSFLAGSRVSADIASAAIMLSELIDETPEYSRTKYDYTYYANGDIDEIIISKLDNLNNVLSTSTIKHYQDGRQPEII